MSVLDNIFWKLDEILSRLEDVEEIVFAPQTVYTAEGLSDISENLGLQVAGEFRTGRGDPGKGDGFSGVRMGYPGFPYEGVVYNIVGVEGDVPQFGLRSSDGLAMFSGGDAAFGARGMRFTADPAVGGTSDADRSRLRWYIASSTVTGASSDADPLAIFQFAVAADTDEHRTTLYMSPNATQGTVVTTDGDFEQRLRLQSYIENREHAAWDISARYQTVYPYAGYLGLVPTETGNSASPLDGSGVLDQGNNTIRSIIQVVSNGGGNEDMINLLPHRQGAVVVLMPDADDETITVKDAANTDVGYFHLAGDFAMDSVTDRLTVLGHDDGVEQFWVEIARSNNG